MKFTMTKYFNGVRFQLKTAPKEGLFLLGSDYFRAAELPTKNL
ncbi:hypothetical protein [Pandoraea apista]|nr:hypothetical protein [Pandoraea apista]